MTTEERRVVRRDITMYGHIVDSDEDSACGNCQKVEEIVKNEISQSSDVPVNYKHYDIYSDPEGKEMVEKKDLYDIPYTTDCKIFNDGSEPDCREVLGYNRKHWKDDTKK